MTEWQTIDTAPKDGTSILVNDGGNVIIAWWDGGWYSGAYEPPQATEVTHWMPLPEAPK